MIATIFLIILLLIIKSNVYFQHSQNDMTHLENFPQNLCYLSQGFFLIFTFLNYLSGIVLHRLKLAKMFFYPDQSPICNRGIKMPVFRKILLFKKYKYLCALNVFKV